MLASLAGDPPAHRDDLAVNHLQTLWNQAGGLPYHLAAWRHRQALWTPYALAVAGFLADWHPRERHLVVVGPSAGWNLPPGFLRQFTQVTAIEPDPLAAWLLQRRNPGARITVCRDDYFTPEHAQGWTANLVRLFADFPDAALLFSDFWGQMIGLHPAAVARETADGVVESWLYLRYKQTLRELLAGRTWASTHDRLVAHAPVAFQQHDLANERPAEALAVLAWPDAPHLARDPLTAGIGDPALPRRLLVWQRLPGTWHLMEAVCQSRLR